ncbi:hypothetical protein [Moorena sp. SIO3A5]|uniref:hypothetical protein n=1 Tax=Moorena sp. SIO3A5 TaxID=2607822 RepID=UPI00141C9521|nr:hypothetical protein [Moorena sp. SIO3A5]NEP67243.1 hypothetical protein [Moorena sp. SIO3A5]
MRVAHKLIADSLPITHYPLPITHYPLPITYYPLLTQHSALFNDDMLKQGWYSP